VKQGAILFAHGSPDARWRVPFENVIKTVEEKIGSFSIMLAYLQFCPPSLADALKMMSDLGVERVVVIPFFLSAGGHIQEDYWKLLEKSRQDFKDIEIISSDVLGEREEVQQAYVRAVIHIINEAGLL
jgi:sirohydrochlorin cobaltochelatase